MTIFPILVPRTTLTPDEALARMKTGNADFLSDNTTVLAMDHDRRLEVALGQAPFAILVGCSDSRVSPELLFGSGLGELFIVRNAGNTVDPVALGSIEYAVLALGVPLIVVLGHQRCGAVQAALQVVEEDVTFPGRIGDMLEPIIPAVLKAKVAVKGDTEALLDTAIRENIRRTVARLRTVPSLTELRDTGKLRIVGAEYSLDNGHVDFFFE